MTPDELEDALARHLAPEPQSDPKWIRELESSVSPALFEALMLRQRLLETLVNREEESAPVSVAVAGSFVRCPFCHSEVTPRASDWVACRACLARHHAACWRESGRCGTCGDPNALPSAAPARPSVRWLAPAAAAAAMFLAVLIAVGTFTRDGRRDRVASLVHRAVHPVAGATIDERLALALAARELAPEDPAVLDAVKKLEAEHLRLAQDEADERAREVQRVNDVVAAVASERESASSELAAVRADLRKEQEAESVRVTAREDRARELIEQAAGLKPTPEAALLLARALALAPRASKVRRQAADDLGRVELVLARRAVDVGDARAASSWLESLEAAETSADQVAEVRASLDNLVSGKKDMADAAEYLEQDNLLDARRAYQRALDRGVAPEKIEPLLGRVTIRCAERAKELVAKAKVYLDAKQIDEAVAVAKEAATYDPSLRSLHDLHDSLDEALVTRAQRDADRLAASADEKGAVAALDRAIAAMHNQELVERTLRAERNQRQRLVEDPDLKAKFVYVRGNVGKSYLIARSLVTNEEFKKFVDGEGYAHAEYWTTLGKRDFDTYKDQTDRPGPRNWVDGSYPAGTEHEPVRGITASEAAAYATWLSSRGSHPGSQGRRATYRLPSSTEWEVAASYDPRTEKPSTYPWGDQFDATALVLGADSPPAAGRGTKKPSPMGLRDACGSLRQWVLDARKAGLKGSDYSCDRKKAEELARVANTSAVTKDTEDLLHCGFRLVRTLD